MSTQESPSSATAKHLRRAANARPRAEDPKCRRDWSQYLSGCVVSPTHLRQEAPVVDHLSAKPPSGASSLEDCRNRVGQFLNGSYSQDLHAALCTKGQDAARGVRFLRTGHGRSEEYDPATTDAQAADAHRRGSPFQDTPLFRVLS